MFSKTFAVAGLLASFAISAVQAVPTVEAVGAKFFYSNGTQFFMKGKPLCIWIEIMANWDRNRVSIDRSRSSNQYRTMPTRCYSYGYIGCELYPSVPC